MKRVTATVYSKSSLFPVVILSGVSIDGISTSEFVDVKKSNLPASIQAGDSVSFDARVIQSTRREFDGDRWVDKTDYRIRQIRDFKVE